jgi:hypothetical protein
MALMRIGGNAAL